MIQNTIKLYAIGQKPDETNAQRYVIEAHPDIQLINAQMIDGGRIAVAGCAPESGPKVLIPLVLAQQGEPIHLMIGEKLGTPVPPIFVQAKDGPIGVYLFPLYPRPGAILKAH